MFSSKKKRQKQRDPPDAALLSSFSVLYAFIDEHKVPWIYRGCADDKGKNKTITQVVAIIALLVTHSHGDWGIVGQLFAFEIAGHAWAWWVAEISKWAAVTLTATSGIYYLWKNREVFLNDC